MPLDTVSRYKRNAEINTELMWQLKAQPCADCKLRWHPSVMTFDHNNRVKHNYISMAEIKSYSPERFKMEIAKCSVVCKNCHFIREMRRDLNSHHYAKRMRGEIEKWLKLCIRGALIPAIFQPQKSEQDT